MPESPNSTSRAEPTIPATASISQSNQAPSFDAREVNDASAVTPIRAGAILVMIFQAAYLIGDRFFLPSPMLRQIFPWQTANLVMAGILLILTRTPEFTRYWRQAMWVASAWTMICVAIITTINGERGPLFVTTLLILLGTGTMMPWGRKWQASLEGVGVISLLFHSRLAEWPNALGYYEWAAVLATVGLAHWSHEAAQRSRGQFSNIIRQLTAAQNTLQTKVAELERTERRARESELALRQVIESSPDIITINRFSDGSWVNLNSTLESTSFPTMDGMGATPWEMGLWADKDQMKSFLAELGAHNRVRNLEISIGSKGGQIVPCLVSAVVTEIRGEKCIVSFTRDISNYKDTQRKLHESEAALRKIFDTSPVTITVSRVSDGRFIMVNKWFLEETGYTSEEIIGKSREEIHLWSDPVQLQAFRAQLLKDGFVSGMELKLNHKDGGLLSHLLSAAVTEIGGEQCVVVIGRNITELKETQRKLRDSESTLRKIIDASPVTISVSTFVDGRYIMVNKGFTQETGYTSEESIGKTTEEVGLWVNREQVLEFVDKLREDLVVNSMEMDLHHKDGHIVTHLLSAVVTEIGGRACVVAVGRDITELKEIQRKLHESEATLRKIVEASPVTITVSRFADGRFIMVNNGFSQETGYSSDEVLGKTSGEVGIFGDRAQLRAFLEQLRKDSVVNSMQMELRHKRGFTTTHLLSAVVTDIGGEQCVVAVGRDITELKKYEAELVAAREAALAAGRAKSEFLSSMSHEIRTPMNAVLGMSELLWETELTEEQRRYVNIMKANGDALLDLINDILDLAKIESGRLNLERADFDLEELTGRLGEMMGIRAHEKGLEIAVRIAPGTPVNLVGDPLRLRQILVNLLGNAIKFTEHGQIVLTVERDTATSAANGGGAVYLRFTVRDTGIGIPKDKIGLIFSSFSQADSSTTRRYGGTGLGLAIVNRLVELYGGKISVESEPGVGSTFTFTARLGVQPPQDTTVEPPTVDLHGVRALIVDDTDVNRLILREIVERAGAEVSEASDGPTALDKFNHARNAKKPFGLVLMDCRMPGMDGLDVLRRVQQICAPGEQPPVVVMLTSDELSVQPARLRELGILAYLVKPVRRLELLGAIKRAMTEQKPIIPVAAVKPAPSPSPLHKSPREDHVAAVVLPPLRVLVADDSQDNRLLVKAYLANSAVKITEAENGSEAIAVYKAGKFDVVLMDMRMPLVDGCAATRAIRAWELEHDLPRTPIIALTASALEDAIRECVMAGCDLHVSKPVRRLGLLDAIANVVKHQRPPEAGETHKAEVVIDPVLRDLIPGFLQSKRADVAAVLTALESGDYALASTVAHQLKGEGGAYGFPTVTDLGRALEAAATNTDRDTALRLARELAQYLENVEVTYRP